MVNQLATYKESMLRSRKDTIKSYMTKVLELSKQNATNILNIATSNIKTLAHKVHTDMMAESANKMKGMYDILG